MLVLAIYSCQQERENVDYDYDTASDSARHYFHLGWQEIMDNGRWTESEAAFRKASNFDPDWLLGKSLVGRITRNTQERERILAELESLKHKAHPDESVLLDCNLMAIQAYNNRDRDIIDKEFNKSRMILGEDHYGRFQRKYPMDNYHKAEYIEFIHHNRGPQTALDSMYALALPNQLELGFYQRYAALLHLELGQMDEAIRLSKALNDNPAYASMPSSLILQANILMRQDSTSKALRLTKQVIDMDSNHLGAIGLKRSIESMRKDSI